MVMGGVSMVILIAGPSHTGKTALAQKLLEKYQYPYLSIDHLKMGLIRSGNTTHTASESDPELTAYLWPIVREMVKTAIENRQNLIVEGCYIPIDWDGDFSEEYRKEIQCIRLILSEHYIRTHFDEIKRYAGVIEQRLDDSYCTVDILLRDNARELSQCRQLGAEYILIDQEYDAALKGILMQLGTR